MKVEWEDIKSEILIELSDVISDYPDIDVKLTLDLFIKVLLHPITEPDLSGVATRLPNALQRLLLGHLSRTDKNSFFPDVAKIEPYCRKVLYLVDYPNYQKIYNDKSGLGAIIPLLSLNPNSVNLNHNGVLPHNKRSHFAEHLIKSYKLRNLESHNCKDWSNAKLYDNLKSVLAMFLYVTHRHFRVLKTIVEPEDLSDYLKKQIKDFKLWQSRFVHIEGKEELLEVELYAKELMESEDEDEYNIREGKISELITEVTERKMVLLGEVGMGKSTTLQYIHLRNSQRALNDSSLPIPLYFELKNLTSRESLLLRIISKLGKDKEFALGLLEEGRLNVFLDGLNEIEKSIKVGVFTEIKNLMGKYPKNFYLITSRPQEYHQQFDSSGPKGKVPVFSLQKMEDTQINEFIEKNGKKHKEYIKSEIFKSDRLKKIVQTPLMLLMLISVIERLGKVPSEKGKIIREFMNGLYDREQKQAFDFDKEEFHFLLCYLGYQTRELSGSNAALNRDEYILPLLKERKRDLGLTSNLLVFLRKALDLQILVEDSNKFSFTHELYQEYYAAEFLLKG